MKDNFSQQADLYARFRPTYPQQLFKYLFSLLENRQCAWDCATGNGQVAVELANYFNEVYATDLSANQLKNAVQKPNIYYSKQPAEQTTFSDGMFDLVTVGQAIHWFKFDAFYKEVKRTLRPGGILAVFGYGLMSSDGEVDDIIRHFYVNIVGSYWDAERRYIEEEYKTIPFPFKEMSTPVFTMHCHWTSEQLVGYLSTWSAVQHYKKERGEDAVDLVKTLLQQAWGKDAIKTFTCPVLARVGKGA